MNIIVTFPPALIIGLLVSTLLPLLVGLVTKTVTDAGVKATLLALLAAATGLLTELLAAVQADKPYDLGTGLLVALTAFLIGAGMHYGLWKPTGLAASAQRVGMKDAGTAGHIPNNITSLPEQGHLDGPDHRA